MRMISKLLTISFLMYSGVLHAQPYTETFESFASGCATSFTNNGITFNGTKLRVWVPGQCSAANLTGLGVGASCSGDGCGGTSNIFLDNATNYGLNQTYIISSSSGVAFALKSMYVYISSNSGSSSTSGSVTFVGKKGGNTIFTFTKTSWPNSTNGFSFVDFASENSTQTMPCSALMQ